MAKPGPKPLPKNVHLLNGNPSKLSQAALFDDCIRPRSEIPDPPDHLLPEALDEWNRLGSELQSLGLISKIDRAAFAVYCQAYGKWVQAENEIFKLGAKGLVIKTPSGYEQPSAWQLLSNKAVEQMKSFLIEFGMTPSARSRVTPSSPQGDLFDDASKGSKKPDYFGTRK